MTTTASRALTLYDSRTQLRASDGFTPHFRLHPKMRRAFLDIDVGDPVAHAAATAAYDRTVSFLAASGAARVGLPPATQLADLDPDTAALLLDAYSADPSWAAKGAPSATPPPSLRAGRLIIELETAAAPRAVANFAALCTGPTSPSATGPLLHYAGVAFHRIVSGFVCQGGDVVFGRGDAPTPAASGRAPPPSTVPSSKTKPRLSNLSTTVAPSATPTAASTAARASFMLCWVERSTRPLFVL